MPNKIDPSLSPPDHISQSNGAEESTSNSTRMSDVALRKKKNADAQAAFRARRANYIATLEETVTSLESVVLQLQDSCREARTESSELKQENARLKHDFREREKFWRAMWQARKSGHGPESDDLPPLPSSFSPSHHSQTNSLNPHLGPSHSTPYNGDGIYRPDDSSLAGPYATGSSHGYSSHSSSVGYAGGDAEQMSGEASAHLGGHRSQKYGPYPYGMQGSSRDGPWPQTIVQTASSGNESGAPGSSTSTHSPNFVESPTLTSPDMNYVNRFPVEDQKAQMNNLETAPYVFPTSRSMSPSTSTPPSSSTSAALTSPFQFSFPEGSVQDRSDYDYRRQSNAHAAEVTLHGGTADISMPGSGSDSLRYRLGARRTNSGPERPLLPAIPHFPNNDHHSHNDRAGSSEGESSYAQPRLRSKRGGSTSTVAAPTAASPTSRSPSPGTPPISGTLAVIKAQAFGALRRTRARTKKSSDGASRAAMEVLEARGIGMGVGVHAGTKRPRLQDDTGDDMQT